MVGIKEMDHGPLGNYANWPQGGLTGNWRASGWFVAKSRIWLAASWALSWDWQS